MNVSAAQAIQNADEENYLTFVCGGIQFALSTLHIRYITASKQGARTVHGRNGRHATLMQFNGDAIVCFKLSEVLNAKSQSEQSAELIKTLEQRKQDHIDWLAALAKSLQTGETFDKATDPHKCAFGKWYDNYRPDDEDLRTLMAGFDAPHKRLHSLAERLLAMTDKNAALAELEAEKHKTLAALIKLFDLVAERLRDLVRPVCIIIENSRRIFAVELDAIQDLVRFDERFVGDDQNLIDDIGSELCGGVFSNAEGRVFLALDPEKMDSGLDHFSGADIP